MIISASLQVYGLIPFCTNALIVDLQKAKVPNGKLPEQLILESRKKEEKREEAIKVTEYNKMMDLMVSIVLFANFFSIYLYCKKTCHLFPCENFGRFEDMNFFCMHSAM